MKTIGFRATASKVFYSIVDDNSISDNYRLVAVECIIVPFALNFPEQLNFLGITIKDIIREYGVEQAGIRTIEATSKNKDIKRISFEAVIQELISSSSVKKYLASDISGIHAKLGIKKDAYKPLIKEKGATHSGIKLAEYNAEERDAILVAIASFKL
ncbi:hypothetical protein GA0116948_103388 [Chitinophaga costaii]|uniref:Uncharacterized protein n=1 Tax=Chitinophaga costaii TaxID=1335309 RepID=A0A1C4C3I7_9BACT|nr:hypothetical protein [Chitinophaga costaii]PUZ27350.1 hypothetical protein DCM91_03725 [Chitinophaga costaii]SCC13655.1 hypothetical protein GA0116948_103388 [Chitinophaga costaii]